MAQDFLDDARVVDADDRAPAAILLRIAVVVDALELLVRVLDQGITVRSAALASKKGMDYAVAMTMDRPEIGGSSGSTLEQTVSRGKVNEKADKVMVIGGAMIISRSPLLLLSRD